MLNLNARSHLMERVLRKGFAVLNRGSEAVQRELVISMYKVCE